MNITPTLGQVYHIGWLFKINRNEVSLLLNKKKTFLMSELYPSSYKL